MTIEKNERTYKLHICFNEYVYADYVYDYVCSRKGNQISKPGEGKQPSFQIPNVSIPISNWVPLPLAFEIKFSFRLLWRKGNPN